jgi:bifunctional ADP-heptose synthase (sugar kinase/adenylyltransferase)
MVITSIENARQVTGIKQINKTSIRNMGQWLLTHIGFENVLITRGNEGMSLFHTHGEVTHIPALIAGYYTLGVMDTIASIIALSPLMYLQCC